MVTRPTPGTAAREPDRQRHLPQLWLADSGGRTPRVLGSRPEQLFRLHWLNALRDQSKSGVKPRTTKEASHDLSVRAQRRWQTRPRIP